MSARKAVREAMAQTDLSAVTPLAQKTEILEHVCRLDTALGVLSLIEENMFQSARGGDAYFALVLARKEIKATTDAMRELT